LAEQLSDGKQYLRAERATCWL